ncbi:MAG TPA: lysylphosphatidylglycerol synthase domain-containing protein [Geminicoccaceae bacterium]|nr:lysylphosphatidylglycerol synthase domain-containing protein [Geminicoccaceae bacterium]
MAAGAVFAWLVGLGLIVVLIVAQGADEIAAAFALAGWSAAALGLTHLGTLLADTLGWRALLRPAHGRPLPALLVKRWIGSSINALLPVAQMGGEFVRARLLARSGTPGAAAGASVVVDLTAGLLTQIAFAALGLALLVRLLGRAGDLIELALGLVLFSLLLLGFASAQRRGLFSLLARPLHRLTGRPGWRALVGSAAALDAEVALRYRRGRALTLCAAWRSLGWLAGGIELWLAFLVLGHPVGLAEAIILESLGQAVRSAGFLIPGGLGVQEGGILMSGIWLGLAPEIVLAAALLKRARELV